MTATRVAIARVLALAALPACESPPRTSSPPCDLAEAAPSVPRLDCPEAFERQRARPLDQAIPGAWTVKTMVDRAALSPGDRGDRGDRGDDDGALHFLDTNAYPGHERFAREHLGWPASASFAGEYLFPQRRFLLGALTYVEAADQFVYEIAPYDTATPDMIAFAIDRICAASFSGKPAFRPTSEEQRALAAMLPGAIEVATTEALLALSPYRPIALGETAGRVRVVSAGTPAPETIHPHEIIASIASSNALGAARDDSADEPPRRARGDPSVRLPDIAMPVAGVVVCAPPATQGAAGAAIWPLSDPAVLAQQRGVPAVIIRAPCDALLALDGTWARLSAGAFAWTIAPVTEAEALALLEHRPAPPALPVPDLAPTAVTDAAALTLADAAGYGFAACHLGEAGRAGAPLAPAIAAPIAHYHAFLAASGLDVRVSDIPADPGFADPAARTALLAGLRADIASAPLDASFAAQLAAAVASLGAPSVVVTASPLAGDTPGAASAGLYASRTVAVAPLAPVGTLDAALADAARAVWASAWTLAAVAERERQGLTGAALAEYAAVGLVIRSEPGAITARGRALTANWFDPGLGGEDALYLVARAGPAGVDRPASDATADELSYFHAYPGQPATAYSRAEADGGPVLTRRERFDLGEALVAIRAHAARERLYPTPPGYALVPIEVGWRRVADPGGGDPRVEIESVRPHPGRGATGPDVDEAAPAR